MTVRCGSVEQRKSANFVAFLLSRSFVYVESASKALEDYEFLPEAVIFQVKVCPRLSSWQSMLTKRHKQILDDNSVYTSFVFLVQSEG